MFHHSFEHIQDPLKTLKYVSKLLSGEGTCLLRTPTTSSYAWNYFKTDWVHLDAPRHFFIQSIDSIKILATNAGLNIKDIIYDSTEVQFWGSEQYMCDIPLESEKSYHKNPSKSIFSASEIKTLRQKSIELNM